MYADQMNDLLFSSARAQFAGCLGKRAMKNILRCDPALGRFLALR